MDAYSEAHLFVAAIRVLQHRQSAPPSLADICELLQISEELANSIRRKLEKQGIISSLEDPFAIKLSVANHQAIETLPKSEAPKDNLAKELAAFQAKKKSSDDKVAAIQAELAKKKQDMFAEIESKLKKELLKKGQ